MAKVFPSFDTIMKSRQKPTVGELFLLHYLEKNFDGEAEVYFQPYLNGDRPDIVIVSKKQGVIIIEVKDWDLKHYYVDAKDHWHLRKNDVELKSPFAQAFGYKTNMFNLHINGLLEKKLENEHFYKAISIFVYFHNESKESIKLFYDKSIDYCRDEIRKNDESVRRNNISPVDHDKRAEFLIRQQRKLERDKNTHTLTNGQFTKLKFPFEKGNEVYPESVHKEFLRYLSPPFHALNDGKIITYSKLQSRLVMSEANARKKIRGVAGSGKTTILAKLAVNAHKRHGDKVLILTFNLTLGMYIRDKINEVREDFSWGVFQINNYHKFMNQMLNYLGIKIEVTDNNESDDFLDQSYYSNEDVFSSCAISDGDKYQTILIDEVQDYKPSWIKIIRSYFLAEQGEMVLFGDEKQNIYKREMEEDKTVRTPNGFKEWEKLTKSFRSAEHSPILELAKAFKVKYFSEDEPKPESEPDDSFQPQLSLSDLDLSQCVNYEENDLEPLVDYVFKAARRYKIHPNEIVIIGSKIALLQEIDFLIRTSEKFNERTLTTFESKEDLKDFSKENQKKIRGKKKTGFNLNSGVIKVSTIHSFKGYESPTVFLIIDDVDSPELVYVGLTRAKINLVVFVKKKSKYEDFFIKSLGKECP